MGEVQDELGELILERLKRLPTHVRIPLEDGRELLLVHGSPTDPAEAMTHDMSEDEIDALIGDDPADIIVCGMSHVPFDRTVVDVRVVNVGSVGEAPGVGSRGGVPHRYRPRDVDSSRSPRGSQWSRSRCPSAPSRRRAARHRGLECSGGSSAMRRGERGKRRTGLSKKLALEPRGPARSDFECQQDRAWPRADDRPSSPCPQSPRVRANDVRVEGRLQRGRRGERRGVAPRAPGQCLVRLDEPDPPRGREDA